ARTEGDVRAQGQGLDARHLGPHAGPGQGARGRAGPGQRQWFGRRQFRQWFRQRRLRQQQFFRQQVFTQCRPGGVMTMRAMGTECGRRDGFTLIELLLAVAVSSIVMFAVGATFTAMLEARAEVEELSESTDAGPRILSMIERDLSHLWTYDIKKNAVL